MPSLQNPTSFLPMTPLEMQARGWEALDVLLITGDAYVDHPSFGAAVIGRVLESAGFRVGILAQPDWTKPQFFCAMGTPRLFVGITAGAMDSMVANYTANRKLRRDDAYSPGSAAGRRPNYATIVYANVARHIFRGVPIVLGGIEASLRRFTHYDYWKDAIRRSILLDAKADLIVAGMGERQVIEIAQRIRDGQSLHGIPGTVEALSASECASLVPPEAAVLPSYEEARDSRECFLDMANQLEKAMSPAGRVPIVQEHSGRFVVEWPPEPITPQALDAVYALPFQRRAHPSYREEIPALRPIQFSITSHRGCFGGCTFCALAMHQGKQVVSRTEDSILREIQCLAQHPDFKGTITDIGGPSANMFGMAGRNPDLCRSCARPSCLFPAICPNLETSPVPMVRLLRKALQVKAVKHLFVASGVRYDLLLDPATLQPRSDAAEYLRLLIEHLVGGHLSVAPEHASAAVLRAMRKPPFRQFEAFLEVFMRMSREAGKRQFIVPYFIASFPGSTENDMRELARFLAKTHWEPQQIQDFLAGPMTLAAAMYYTQMNPQTRQPIPVAKGDADRRRQREIIQPSRERGISHKPADSFPRRPASRSVPRAASAPLRKRRARSN